MKSALTLALAGLLGHTAPAIAEVVLINAFEVPAGQREAAIAEWKDARDFLATQPGYIDAALHNAVTPAARFGLVNIARWESPEAFIAATRAMQAAGVFVPPAGLVANSALYTVVHAD